MPLSLIIIPAAHSYPLTWPRFYRHDTQASNLFSYADRPPPPHRISAIIHMTSAFVKTCRFSVHHVPDPQRKPIPSCCAPYNWYKNIGAAAIDNNSGVRGNIYFYKRHLRGDRCNSGNNLFMLWPVFRTINLTGRCLLSIRHWLWFSARCGWPKCAAHRPPGSCQWYRLNLQSSELTYHLLYR